MQTTVTYFKEKHVTEGESDEDKKLVDLRIRSRTLKGLGIEKTKEKPGSNHILQLKTFFSIFEINFQNFRIKPTSISIIFEEHLRKLLQFDHRKEVQS